MWKSLFDFEGRNAYATLTSVAKPRTESQMLLTPWSTLIGVTNAVIQYRSPGGTWHEPQRVLSLREGRNIRGEFSIGFALDNTHKIFLSHLQYGLCRTSIVPSFGTQQIHCLWDRTNNSEMAFKNMNYGIVEEVTPLHSVNSVFRKRIRATKTCQRSKDSSYIWVNLLIEKPPHEESVHESRNPPTCEEISSGTGKTWKTFRQTVSPSITK